MRTIDIRLTMSAFDLITKPIPEITDFLKAHNIELKKTKYEDVYLIKFTPLTDVSHPAVNQIKGLIFNHRTGEIISMTHPVPIEIKDLESEKQEKLFQLLEKNQYTVTQVPDGTLLRYSYLPESEQWIISTNSKEDASEAFWMNNVSLIQQFESANNGKINTNNLNKNYIYMFVLCHPLNVIVVNHQKPEIYHVATYDKKTLTQIDCDLGIPKPKKYDYTIQQIVDLTRQSVNKPVESAGFMVISESFGIHFRYRFENANYTRARQLRGDSNNIDYILLNISQQGVDAIQEFFEYYPIYISLYNHLLLRVNQLIDKLYREYGLRYKKKSNIRVHPRHHKFLGLIHQNLYIGTLQPMGKTVQFRDIDKFVRNQPTAKLLYLLNYIYDTGY